MCNCNGTSKKSNSNCLTQLPKFISEEMSEQRPSTIFMRNSAVWRLRVNSKFHGRRTLSAGFTVGDKLETQYFFLIFVTLKLIFDLPKSVRVIYFDPKIVFLHLSTLHMSKHEWFLSYVLGFVFLMVFYQYNVFASVWPISLGGFFDHWIKTEPPHILTKFWKKIFFRNLPIFHISVNFQWFSNISFEC